MSNEEESENYGEYEEEDDNLEVFDKNILIRWFNHMNMVCWVIFLGETCEWQEKREKTT